MGAILLLAVILSKLWIVTVREAFEGDWRRRWIGERKEKGRRKEAVTRIYFIKQLKCQFLFLEPEMKEVKSERVVDRETMLCQNLWVAPQL